MLLRLKAGPPLSVAIGDKLAQSGSKLFYLAKASFAVVFKKLFNFISLPIAEKMVPGSLSLPMFNAGIPETNPISDLFIDLFDTCRLFGQV